jgi:hypothetical protein
MEMKDRVDNFLKVAKERMSNNIANSESRYHLNDLCGSLMDLAKADKELVDYLEVEYNKILDEVKLQEWDERFLNIIAGEDIRSREEKLYDLNRQVSQGRSKQRMGQTLAAPLTPTGMSTNAVWTNNNASLEKELQELKDEIRANRSAQKV